MRTPDPRWLLAAVLATLATAGSAHEPVMKCVLLGDSSVRCRGGSNDGDDMPGARIEVLDHANRTLVAGKLGADSTFTFRKPAQPFYVLFDTGPGLQVTVEQEEITALPAGRGAKWMQGQR